VNLVLVPASRSDAIAFDVSLVAAVDEFDADDDDRYDELMSVFQSDQAVNIGKYFEAVQAIIGPSVPGRDPFWAGDAYGDEDGFGEVHFCSPEEVAAIAVKLAGLDRETASDRYDAALMLGGLIYPTEWTSQGRGDETRARALDLGMAVVALFEDAAADGSGILASLQI
jgi:Domain of unknown function (DUF1877)